MRFIVSAFVAVIATVPATSAPAAEEILQRARQALGDVSSLQSLSISGIRRVSVQTPEGPGTASRESEMHFLMPDKFYRAEAMEMPGGMMGPTLIDALNGDTAWHDTQNAPTAGNIVVVRRVPPGVTGPDAEAARARMLKTQYLRNWLLMTLTPPADYGVKFDYTGEAESPDGRLWMIDASGPDRFALRLFIDQKTNLPVMASWRGLQAAPVIRTVRAEGPPQRDRSPEGLPAPDAPKPQEVEFEVRLSEHMREGGILFPKLMTVSADSKLTEEFELKNIKVNPKLRAEKFRK